MALFTLTIRGIRGFNLYFVIICYVRKSIKNMRALESQGQVLNELHISMTSLSQDHTRRTLAYDVFSLRLLLFRF